MVPTSQITKIRGANYKAFGDPFELELAPLTLVFGRNGSGKTALLRLPLLLREALVGIEAPGLPLRARGLVVGNSLGSFVHGGAADRYELGLTLEHHDTRQTLDVVIGHDRSTPVRLPGQWIDRWELRAETGAGASFTWDPRTKHYVTEEATVVAPATFRGLRPILADGSSHTVVRSLGIPPRVIHLAAARGVPGEDFVPEQPNVLLDVESDGAATRRVLGALRSHPREEILEAIKKGVRECFGVELRVEEVAQGSTQGTVLTAKPCERDTWLPIAELGTGVVHALPLLTQYAIAAHRADDEPPYVVLCEEPEAHAHPLVQAQIADVILDSVRAGRCSTVLETHSETFVLRIRRRVAEGSMRPDDVALYFVDDEGPVTEVRRLRLDEHGHIDGWPEGWFDTAVRELRAIHRALGSP